MKILVVGSGGREHAIVWKLRQSPSVEKIYCAPGNAGIEQIAELVPLKATDLSALLEFAKRNNIDLTVVGPEQPLVSGIVDLFEANRLKIFGPRRAAAILEGSKVFAKNFMKKYGIPTARYRSFSADQRREAGSFIHKLSTPLVVKADGLAAGKGVLICETRQQAIDVLEEIVVKKIFGSAGEQVVVEEYLQGEEASVLVVTDGKDFVTLTPAQDHKRTLDGDRGKNTGGMGAYAPAPVAADEVLKRVIDEIVKPTLAGMNSEGTPYRGCLYLGLMITAEGPKVLEYNCRFGDPEAQVVLPLIEGDFARLLLSVANGKLDKQNAELHRGSAVCVVMASRGYPDEYESSKIINGLDLLEREKNVIVFHAGTKKEGDRIVTCGGRVLGVTALGYNQELEETIQRAYRAVRKISFDGAYYRTDIGQRALKRFAKTKSRVQIPNLPTNVSK